jgi:hypothetical protein
MLNRNGQKRLNSAAISAKSHNSSKNSNRLSNREIKEKLRLKINQKRLTEVAEDDNEGSSERLKT